MWHHPKYYKELRKRNKSDQVISETKPTGDGERAPGQGLKVTSYKLPGPKPISNANKGLIHKQQAASKEQASSTKLQAFEPTCSIAKRQASQPE